MATKRTAQQLERDIQQIKRNLEETQAKFQRAMVGRVFAVKTLVELQRIPGAPRHPIRFTTDRQRGAYFATDGFGWGIPSRRTGRIAEGWSVGFIPTQEGGLLVLSNIHPEAKFVHGPQPFGQGFHIDTGWTQVDTIEDQFYNETIGEATAVFFDDLDFFEGL